MASHCMQAHYYKWQYNITPGYNPSFHQDYRYSREILGQEIVYQRRDYMETTYGKPQVSTTGIKSS